MSQEDQPEENIGQTLWDEHALACGRIALAWNALQETLAELYADLFERSNWKLAIASWHSLVSDAAQQEMLRSVAKEKYGKDSRAYTEINWMLERTKQHSSHQRNFGVHTPFMILRKLDQTTHVLPHAHAGNRRAAALSDKDVLKEFATFEQELRKLTSFAMGLTFVLSPVRSGPESWPERPQLRSAAPSLNPKN
jgi:hypothetical protein